ncbi:MAG: efflux RND transporter periplasmic adaptor subunit, partial [Alphaproteobacteria bacterium]
MRTTFRALVGFVGLLLVTVGIGFGGFQMVKARMDNNASSGGRGGGFFGAQEPTYTVDLVTFERADYTPTINGFGSITAGRTADLRPLVSGLLESTSERLVEGALIREGTTLFTVDPFDFDIAVKDASIALRDAQAKLVTAKSDLAVEEAALKLAQDQLALSEAELARQQDLRKEGIISAAALGNAENATLSSRAAVDARAAVVARTAAAVPTAELAVERAALTLERAQRELANTSLKAPFNGVAQDVSFALGRQVSTNDVLARLVDLQQMELKFQLSDEQLGALIGSGGNRRALNGLPVTLVWDVGSQQLEYTAEIDRTAVAISENQGGIDVFARLTNVNPGNIPPVGAFMAYSFPEPTIEGVFAVPALAVSPSGEMFAVSDKNRITTFNVTIERRVGDLTIVSGDAVEEGKSFVARRFIQLGEGTKVNPNRPEVPMGEDEAVAEAEMGGSPGGFPTEGPIEMTKEQQDCMIELVQNSDLPATPKSFIIPALQSGTIADPGRMAGLKERAGLDLDSCFPAVPAAAVAQVDPGGFPTEGPVELTEAQKTCLIDMVENSDLQATPKGFIIPALESG